MKSTNIKQTLISVLRIFAIFVFLIALSTVLLLVGFSNFFGDALRQQPQSEEDIIVLAAGFWSIVIFFAALVILLISVLTIVLTSRSIKKSKLQPKAGPRS
jgi:uncharacterized BrkB/YihY/UPF0761 family membrane protein